ncbi:MAG: MarR family transcriptional regulator [Burkholderiaceae bacterium]
MDENLHQLLLHRADWFAAEIMRGIRKSPYPQITPSQSRLLAHMAGRPTSMAELARRLAISRQAVHKTVNELARQGILEVHKDPERGNATLVTYTAKGRAINRAGAAIIESAEARIAEQIGPDTLERLKNLLRRDWD